MAQSDWAEEKKLSAGVSHSDATGSSSEPSSNFATGQEGKHLGRPPGPKGVNLQEGGFDSDDRKNASFTADIGTENDPGRQAEKTFAALNADGGVGLPKQRKLSGETPY